MVSGGSGDSCGCETVSSSGGKGRVNMVINSARQL